MEGLTVAVSTGYNCISFSLDPFHLHIFSTT